MSIQYKLFAFSTPHWLLLPLISLDKCILSHYNTNLYLLACITCAFKFVFSGIFARAPILWLQHISCGKSFSYFCFQEIRLLFRFFFCSKKSKGEKAVSFVISCFVQSGSIYPYPKTIFVRKIIMNKINSKVRTESIRK